MSLSLDDLHPWAREQFEADYRERPGRDTDGSHRQSRADFAAGYLACLLRHGLTGVFTPAARDREGLT